jgi:hypothetical protein
MTKRADEDVLAAIVAMKACGRHTWREIGEELGLSLCAVKGRHIRRPEGVEAGPCPRCARGGEPEKRHRVEFEEEGNCAEARSQSERIKTLEQLLEAAEVDLDVWDIRDWGVKKWEVGAKLKEGHLEWDQGRIDGYLNYLGLGVQDLWSVWAKFFRKEPVAVFPVLRPVACKATFRPSTSSGQALSEGIRRVLVFADPQFGFSREVPSARLEPFHDRAVLDVILQVASEEAPAEIYLLGDCFDFVMWTDRFLRSPKFEYTCTRGITTSG